jgi:hypothetical protein
MGLEREGQRADRGREEPIAGGPRQGKGSADLVSGWAIAGGCWAGAWREPGGGGDLLGASRGFCKRNVPILIPFSTDYPPAVDILVKQVSRKFMGFSARDLPYEGRAWRDAWNSSVVRFNLFFGKYLGVSVVGGRREARSGRQRAVIGLGDSGTLPGRLVRGIRGFQQVIHNGVQVKRTGLRKYL